MSSAQQHVLVSGASFAGLATAFWMRRLGHAVTVVELAPDLRRNGAAVDIQDGCVDVIREMGLLDQVLANRLSLQRLEFKGADDVTQRVLTVQAEGEPPSQTDVEIERGVLLDLLYEAIGSGVEWIFGDSITALRATPASVEATFAHAAPRTFDLVFGCDGFHSTVRRLCFGPEATYAQPLGLYFSITIVDEFLIEPNTAQMFNVPGKAVMLNAYQGKTDVIFIFAADGEMPFGHRDQRRQRQMIADQFADTGWRTADLLAKVRESADFYFDAFGQIKMPSWSKGHIALVGDAGYCASPAAGRGGSLALQGAAALATAMTDHEGHFEPAFRDYDERFRQLVDDVQREAATFAVESLAPRTQAAIDARNAKRGRVF